MNINVEYGNFVGTYRYYSETGNLYKIGRGRYLTDKHYEFWYDEENNILSLSDDNEDYIDDYVLCTQEHINNVKKTK